MAIVAYAGANLILQATPAFQVDTLAELPAIIAGDPATYEGKYIVVLDQPVGDQVYIVDSGVAYVASSAAQTAWIKRQGGIYYDSAGLEIANVVTQVFSGTVAGGDGQVTVNITQDGTAGGIAMFSSVLDVSGSVGAAVGTQPISANVYQRPFMGPWSHAANLKQLTAAFLTGRLVTLALTSLNPAPNGTLVKIAVTGVKA